MTENTFHTNGNELRITVDTRLPTWRSDAVRLFLLHAWLDRRVLRLVSPAWTIAAHLASSRAGYIYNGVEWYCLKTQGDSVPAPGVHTFVAARVMHDSDIKWLDTHSNFPIHYDEDIVGGAAIRIRWGRPRPHGRPYPRQ